VCVVVVSVDGDDAMIEVRDDGPGMAASDATLAFDRFHRADTSRTRTSGGSGLGLSIVSAIMSAHGGTAELESKPGVGTTIRIRLPQAGPSHFGSGANGADEEATAP
jgi:two-component system OmpR family sensor kinase